MMSRRAKLFDKEESMGETHECKAVFDNPEIFKTMRARGAGLIGSKIDGIEVEPGMSFLFTGTESPQDIGVWVAGNDGLRRPSHPKADESP